MLLLFRLLHVIDENIYLSGKNRVGMDRIFHARILPAQILWVALVAFLAVWALWEKHPLLAAVFMLCLVFSIERLIHTVYTVTADGRLIVCRGRFARCRERRLEDIVSVQRATSAKFGRRALFSYVLLVYKDGRHDALQPVKEEEFVSLLEKRIYDLHTRAQHAAE